MKASAQLLYVFLATAATAGCDLLERPEVSYDNMAEAVEHGAIGRGWIPEWIPAHATNIREMHDLDTNESMMVFDLPETMAWRLPTGCEQVPYNKIGPPRFSRSWWPSKDELQNSYVFHKCAGDDPWTPKFVWVARHQSGKKALHWRAYAL